MHVNTSNARQRTEQTEGYKEQTNDQNKKQVRQINQTMSIHDNKWKHAKQKGNNEKQTKGASQFAYLFYAVL